MSEIVQPAGWYRSFCGRTNRAHYFPEIIAPGYVVSICSSDIIAYKGACPESATTVRCKKCERKLRAKS